MTTININHKSIITADISGVDSIFYKYLGDKVYSAEKVEKMCGVFLSDIVYVDQYSFAAWNQITWSGSGSVSIFVRTSSTATGVSTADWYGPYPESEIDISSLTGGYLQLMVGICAESGSIPQIDSVQIYFLSYQTAVKFYSRTFELGFVPKHIVLTYNATVSDDAILKFAVAGEETTDNSQYQYITPNQLVELRNISRISDGIKVLIEMTGDSSIPITVHEYALIVGGSTATKINEVYYQSSSSSSSSESSSSSSNSSSSSSSSSIDSSSSSSSSSMLLSSSSSSQSSSSSSSSS